MRRLLLAIWLIGAMLVLGAAAASADVCPDGLRRFDPASQTQVCGMPAAASAVAEHASVQARLKIPTKSVVTSAVDLSAVKDPAQRKAEEEFLKTAIAKEKTYYDGNADAYVNFYADNAISVQPSTEEIDGKAALAEGLKPYMQANRVIGNLTIKRAWVFGDHATRQAQWEEWVLPKDGSAGEHHIGRCTLNWEKINGEWKVTSEYINYLEPPAPFQQ